MLSHHAEVYRELKKQFPDAEVYVSTTDKTDSDQSPFNFSEKQRIIAAHGIPADRVIQTISPYNNQEYLKIFDPDNTMLIFAVGEKDMDRFPFSNVDPKTGLDMTVRGEPKPKYLQQINTYRTDPQSMRTRGYITLAPTVKQDGAVAKASDFRDAIKRAPDAEAAKQTFSKQFGQFDQEVFDLIYNKIKGTAMSEQLDILRKLAGLSEAPVQMPKKVGPGRYGLRVNPDTGKPFKGVADYQKWKATQSGGTAVPGAGPKAQVDPRSGLEYEAPTGKDRQAAADRVAAAAGSDPLKATFSKIKPEDMKKDGKIIPSKQRRNSIANRFPEDADINDPAVKKDMFLKIATRSPYLLFSEINARLGNDDNSVAVSDRLSDIVSQFQDGKSMMELSPEDKTFALRVLGTAIKDMELVRATDYDTNLDSPEVMQADPDDTDADLKDVGDVEDDDIEADDWQLAADRNQRESIDLSHIRAEYGVNEGDTNSEEYDIESLQKMFGPETAYDAASHKPAMMIRKDKKGNSHSLVKLPNGNYYSSDVKQDQVKEGNTDERWKFSTMDYDEAVKKYGKDKVRKGPKNRAGQPTIEILSEVDEKAVSGGVTEAKEDLASLRAKSKEINDQIEAIVQDGGKVGFDDPLSRQLSNIRAKIKKLKSSKKGVAEQRVAETTNNAMQAAIAELRKLAGL